MTARKKRQSKTSSKTATKRTKVAAAASPRKDGEGLFSISALADLFDSHRATVRKALKGIPPAVSLPKLKQYRLTDTAKDGRTVKEILEADEDPEVKDLRKRKLRAEAVRIETRNEREGRQVVPISEVRDYAFHLAKSMHNWWLRYGKNSGRHLGLKPAKIKKFNADIEQFFTQLRIDHSDLL